MWLQGTNTMHRDIYNNECHSPHTHQANVYNHVLGQDIYGCMKLHQIEDDNHGMLKCNDGDATL